MMDGNPDDKQLSERDAALTARRDEINFLAKQAYESYRSSGLWDSAFGELLKKLYAYTYPRLSKVYGLDFDQRKDIYQDIALRFWKYAKTYKEQEPFLAWWNTIVYRVVLDFKRKNAKHLYYETTADDERLIDSSSDGRQHAKKIEQSAVDGDILDRLSEYDRDILYLHYRDDLTALQISKQLGIPVDKVRYHIRRALGRFRALYESGNIVRSGPTQEPARGGSPDAA